MLRCRSKGCGIVEYSDINDAARALSSLNGVELKGRPIIIREDREANQTAHNSSSSHPEVSSGRNKDSEVITLESPRLYVNNLAWDVAWQDLKDFFRQVLALPL